MVSTTALFTVVPPPPPPPPSPPSPPSPPPPPPTGVDPFGVVMLYPNSTTRPDSWFMNMNNPNENRRRFDVDENSSSSLSRNSDGSWKIRDTQIRMDVYNRNGYTRGESIPTYDRNVMTQKGYMQDPDDWKNVEMTMFVKCNTSISGESRYFSPYARSGTHSTGTASSGENIRCEGTGVKPRVYLDGQVAEVKEMWHNEGYAVRNRDNSKVTSIVGRWVGIKSVMWNVRLSNGGIGVHQELWIHESGNPGLRSSWRKVVDGTDTGGFGSNGDQINSGSTCRNARPDQPIFWGGPIATFRWDNMTDVDFKWFSIREIQPPA
jgi:hypothetical protein